jgi:hypothetical protein
MLYQGSTVHELVALCSLSCLFLHVDAVREPRKAGDGTIEENGKLTGELCLMYELDRSGDTSVG